MSARKMRELQEQLDAREKELSAVQIRAAELQKRVEDYQARESAIVRALSQAQESAERLMKDAESQRAELIESAERKLNDASMEADSKLSEANMKVAALRAEAEAECERLRGAAKTDADNLMLSAQAEVENCRVQLSGLKRELADAARAAMEQAERFKSYLGSVSVKGDEREEDEKLHTSTPAQTELPEDYATPSELMRSIYAMQGRELPGEQAGAVGQTASTEEQPGETVEQPLHSWGWHMPQPAEQAAGSAPEEAPEEAQAEQTEETSEEAQTEQIEESDHVWTVDEIVEAELNAGSNGNEADGKADSTADDNADIDLDKLISDLINLD